jgi:hypothetical protein
MLCLELGQFKQFNNFAPFFVVLSSSVLMLCIFCSHVMYIGAAAVPLKIGFCLKNYSKTTFTFSSRIHGLVSIYCVLNCKIDR